MNLLIKARTILKRLVRRNSNSSEKSQTKVKPYVIKNTTPAFLYENGDILEISERLLSLLETSKPFLDPALRLESLAKSLNTNRNYLSKAINDCCQTNFCQLCNYYRIREACMIFLKNPGIDKSMWIELSGFGSASTFSSYFSKLVGQPPAKWQRTVIQRIKRKENVRADDYIRDFRSMLYR